MLLIILFVLPVGNVVGQTSPGTALSLDVNSECKYKTIEFYKFQNAWFVFQPTDSLTEIRIADHVSTTVPAPIFDSIIVYDNNLSIVVVFDINSASWSDTVQTPAVGSHYYIWVKANTVYEKCDFDICLSRDCNDNIYLINPEFCLGDPLCFDVVNCIGGNTLSLIVGNVVVASQPAPPDGIAHHTYCFSSSVLPTGSTSFEVCLQESSSGISWYCESFTANIVPPPTIDIVEGDGVLCMGQNYFHALVTDSYDVDWSLYYYYPGVGWNIVDWKYNQLPDYIYSPFFNFDGSYYVVATATNECGVDSDTIQIQIIPPSAEFAWDDACLGDTICFTDLSVCPSYWNWDFGDGNSSTEQSPCYTYTFAGTFLVTLEVAPGVTVSHTITVNAPIQPEISGNAAPYAYACGNPNHYDLIPAGAFTQIGWAVNSPSGWVMTTPPDEFNYAWNNGIGGVVYVETMDMNGCIGSDSLVVFDCCSGGDTTWFNQQVSSSISVNNTTIMINGSGNVLLTGSHIVIHGCNIFMAPNAKVTVESGAFLRIEKSEIRACNNLMWDGFYVENGGYIEFDGNTLIQDAKNAVVSLNGGECVIRSNYFDKNYRDVVINPYSSNHPAKIERNKFLCTGTLLPQYPAVIASRTQYAVLVQNVSSIILGGKNKGNIFDNCDVGIMSTNSFIEVVDNTFQNIEPGSVIPGQVNNLRGYGIATSSLDISGTNPYGLKTNTGNMSVGGNTFNNVTNGIFSFNNGQVFIRFNKFNYLNNTMGRGTAISLSEWSHPVSTKYITGNIIDNYNKGIVVTGTNNVNVYSNLIKNIKVAPIPLSNLRAMGIRIEGGSNNVVQGNTVQNNNASSADWRWEGVSVSNSGSLMVSCNTLRKMGKSIRFQGVNASVQIKKNDMYNGTAGIVLSDNGYINAQGTNGTPWDNRWIGSSFTSHLYTMNSTDASQITFHLVLPISSYWTQEKNPQPFLNGNGGASFPFNLALDNGYLQMLCAIPLNSASPAYASWMDDMADNNIYNLNNPQYRNWLGRDKLYKTILQDSSLIQSSSLQNFRQQLQSETQGILENVKDLLHSNNIADAKILNQNLLPYTKPDSITQSVNSIGINAVLNSSSDWQTAISSQGWDSLRMIAQLCPFEYGENVYLARVVLKLAGDTAEYLNECETDAPDMPEKSMMFGSDNEFTTIVYPNPAQNEINIETDITLPATLTLYSATGQRLYSVQISDTVSKVAIDFIRPQLLLYEVGNASGETNRGTLTKTE